MSKTQNQNQAPRSSQRAYVDVPVLKNPPRRPSLAEISPSELLKKKDASLGKENASKRKIDASVIPLQPSKLSNHVSSKKRAREDDADDDDAKKDAPIKKRNTNVDQPKKKKSIQSISSGSLTPTSDHEVPVQEAPVKKVVVKKPQEPLWTRVGVDWTLEEIENRILLREFVIRFNGCFDLKKPMLEKLEDFAEFDDSLAKALLFSFVEMLKNEGPSEERRKLNEFIKQIRARGMSFYDILSTMNTFRTKTSLHIPDLTKVLKRKPDTVEADALIPVLLNLIDDLMVTKSLRAEIDKYKEESVDIRKEHYATMKEERERWSKIRTALMEEKKQAAAGFDLAKWKVKFEKAKSKHDTIDLTEKHDYLKKQAAISLRFTPYADKDGRTYYIHTPSLRKPILKSTREEFSRWVWFVTVWGKRPEEATRVDVEEEDDDGKEGWWAFGDAAEVKKLAQWIQWKDGVDKEEAKEGSEEGADEEADSGVNATKRLVDALNGFVTVLQYADDSVSK